uniref:Uncharacterized protein n=1 Tax=Anguilla anguilla TaxID=7936 RepID=A0A0E9T6L4_ANGAN
MSRLQAWSFRNTRRGLRKKGTCLITTHPLNYHTPI